MSLSELSNVKIEHLARIMREILVFYKVESKTVNDHTDTENVVFG